MKTRDLRNFSDDFRKFASDLSADDFLRRVGLERRREPLDYMLPVVGIFGAGIAVGLAIGLLGAPKRGEELRGDLRTQMSRMKHRVQSQAHEKQAELSRQAPLS